jgi:hypothetical protein
MAREAIRKSRLVDVGWLIDAEEAEFIYEAPRPISKDRAPPLSPKAVQNCPAVNTFEGRCFEVQVPFDLRLRLTENPDGSPALMRVPEGSSLEAPAAKKLVMIMPQEAWRSPEHPVVQIQTPYLFLADELVYINQLPPVFHFPDPPRPGVQICGRFPIDVWPRKLSWALEWIDQSKDLILKRGEPWFYVTFETPDPSRGLRLFEAASTPELEEYRRGVKSVVSYVSQAFSLFPTARSRRPKKLLVKRER